MEKVADATTVIFDKTGTLTNACPTVVDVIPFNGQDADEMLRVAACMEEHFPHSMANAVVRAAREKGLLAPDGRGWKSGLSGADAEAVRDLGAADPLSKPPFQKLPVLENAARWTVPAVRKARLALMRGHEHLVSSSAPPSTVLELAICEALS